MALHPAEEALRLVELAIVLVDPDGTVVLANPAAEAQLELHVGDDISAVLRSGWPNWDTVIRLAHANQSHHCDARDPAGRDVRVVVRPRDGGGAMIKIRRVEGADISARFGDEMEVGYQQVLDELQVGLLRADPVTTELWLTSGCHSILGQAPGPFTIEQGLERLSPENQAVFAEAMNASVVQDAPFDLHLPFRGPGDETHHVHARGQVVRRTDGRPVAYIGAVKDETELVRTRTQLSDVRRQLERAQRLGMTGQLATGVAHDLNNVLTAILGHAELLNISDLSAEDQESIEEIVDAGQHAAELARHLLALGRRAPLVLQTLNLGEHVTHACRLMRRIVPEPVELRIRCEDGAALWTRADPTQLEQVLFNLVLNAVHAVKERGAVDVSVEREDTQLVLRVRDDGCGMDETTRSRIFEPFFTTRGTQGTGLGLASVQGIVQQHEGTIEVDSALGVGTTFTIRLVAAEAPAPARPEAPWPTTSTPTPNGLRVLLVEDQRLVRIVAEQILRRAGYDVRSSASPKTAEAQIDPDWVPDLLVTDVIMPHIDGPTLAARVLEDHPNARVLYVSGYPAPLLDERGVLRTDAPLLAKPFTRKALLDAVSAALSGLAQPA